jgi:hypothetical protein
MLNTLNTDLNPICHLPALLGAHHILHVSSIRVKAQIVTEVWSKFVNKGLHNFTPYQMPSFTFMFVAVMGVEPTLGIGL